MRWHTNLLLLTPLLATAVWSQGHQRRRPKQLTIGCGGRSSDNCTYFDGGGSGAVGGCLATVCPCSADICQIRLDFALFSISGPSTATSSVVKNLAGVPVDADTKAKSFTNAGRCLTDTFSVVVPSNNGGGGSDQLCGVNTGQHLYVDVAGGCAELAFQLSPGGSAQGGTAPQWSIKVSQYSCSFPNLAPAGCSQWHFGPSSGSVQSFNFAGGRHLAGQRQTICVRRERNNCRICWTTLTPAKSDFAISGNPLAAKTMLKSINSGLSCCDYGSKGSALIGYDCVMIPGARSNGVTNNNKNNNNNVAKLANSSQFCGSGFGLVLGNKMTTKNKKTKTGVTTTICSILQPFMLTFQSDTFESVKREGANTNQGFRLAYFMDAVGCNYG